MIDFAHHRGHAAQALRETVRFSDAINATINMIDTKDTLVIVTSDHTHSMNFNGYSDRGSSILGTKQEHSFFVNNIIFFSFLRIKTINSCGSQVLHKNPNTTGYLTRP